MVTLNEYIKPIIHDGLDVQGLENSMPYLYGDEMAALQNYAPCWFTLLRRLCLRLSLISII